MDISATAPRSGAVLDVGTGPGVLLVELARHRPDLRLTGIDLSADMVERASANLARSGEKKKKKKVPGWPMWPTCRSPSVPSIWWCPR